jgi:hypothetical protein
MTEALLYGTACHESGLRQFLPASSGAGDGGSAAICDAVMTWGRMRKSEIGFLMGRNLIPDPVNGAGARYHFDFTAITTDES